ncbi:MAG TPA: outer membrane protein assembly factor BamE [Steroidobacteraceae bacterium]|jgi:outer membrane protein assembly factor BamE
MRIIPLILAAWVATGCVYRMPIQQGNYLDPAAIAQVKVGMTHSQVRYLLGTPMVPGGFDDARWDYDYYLKTRRLQTPKRGHVVILFENSLVAKVDSNVTTAPLTPSGQKDVAAPEPHNARY